jgi:NAD(P)-dependent dehydrogenase (short-subunit alcohol dehydrogenase family)
MAENALIVGTGPGLSASLARLCAQEGMKVAVAARNPKKLDNLVQQTGARAYACDATKREDVEKLFDQVERDLGPLDLVTYNASGRPARGPVTDVDPVAVYDSLMVTCYGGFLVAHHAAKRMVPRGKGSILLTGASASVKGYAQSTPFAMGKFGLRGLAQSMARELAPKNIHVAHFIIDGGIRKADGAHPRAGDLGPDGLLVPDEIARAYLQIHRQHRSTWTWEIELRPWVEKF